MISLYNFFKRRGEWKMMLNRIVITAIILIILLTLLQLFIKISFGLFIFLLIVFIVLGIWGFMKGDK